MDKNIAIVLPAFNEAEYIGPVLKELEHYANKEGYRVVVVDDGSTDNTASIVKEHNAVLVQHKVNKGLGRTFRTAVDYCLENNIDAMVFFDADGQFHVEDIEKVVEPVLTEKRDFALGSRFINGIPENMPKAKVMGNKFLAWFISKVTGRKIQDIACGFRAYSREALLRINTTGRFTYTQEVILDLLFKGLSVVEVPIAVTYFKDRQSTISSNLWKYGWRVFKIIARTVRDYKPLAFFGTVGIGLFSIGLALDAWMVAYYIQNGAFSPYKIIGFAGAFLNFLGITIWFIGSVADMLNRSQKTQEEILYRLKKNADHKN